MKKRTMIIILALTAVLVTVTVLTSAYLTDLERANNIITIGNVALSLEEEHYQDNMIAVPGEKIPKDPLIINTGSKDEFVFIRVAIPKKDVTLLYEADDSESNAQEGKKIDSSPSRIEIFKIIAEQENSSDVPNNKPPYVVVSYNRGENNVDGWVYLTQKDTYDYNYYYFGYNKKLLANDEENGKTISLFDSVKLKSFIESQVSDNAGDVRIEITAYGIQADKLEMGSLSDNNQGYLTEEQLQEIFLIVMNKAGDEV